MAKLSKTILRVAVSAILVAVLLYVAKRQRVLDVLRSVPPSSVLTGLGLLAIAWLINSQRWSLLLRAAGVVETPLYLAGLYFIGMFFSMILPTGAGGDAARMWDISRRHGKPAAAIVATLQERLLGMGTSMIVGLLAATMYYDKLPAATRLPLLCTPILAVLASAFFLYPRLPISIGTTFWRRFAPPETNTTTPPTLFSKATSAIARSAARAAELPPLTLARLVPIVLVTLTGVFFSIAAWWALGRGVGLTLGYTAYCLVVPLVWIISMTPSIGGIGVREGGFVFLMKLFGVATQAALSVAALYLIVQTILACIGGLILMTRVWSGTWQTRPKGGDAIIDMSGNAT